MEIPDELVYPYASTPPRIALDVAEALARCPTVSRVSLFGSLASRTNDGWSDIDMMCVTPGPAGAWEAVRVLCDAMPLRWHGPFSDMPLPSGRYWPYGESIFHSVDLSFRTAEDHERVLTEGLRGVPVAVRDVLLREPLPGLTFDAGISEDVGEYPFTSALYAAIKAMKAYLRTEGDWVDVSARMDALETEARLLPRRPSGGRPEDVLDEARSLYQRLLMERLRFGAGGGS